MLRGRRDCDGLISGAVRLAHMRGVLPWVAGSYGGTSPLSAGSYGGDDLGPGLLAAFGILRGFGRMGAEGWRDVGEGRGEGEKKKARRHSPGWRAPAGFGVRRDQLMRVTRVTRNSCHAESFRRTAMGLFM